MTFDTNLKAITQKHLLPKVVDTVLGSNVHAFRALSNMKRWEGETLDKSVQTASAANGGSFSGLDKFNTNAVDVNQRLEFDIRAYYQSIVVPGIEKQVNRNSRKSVALVASQMEQGANAMADGIGTLLYGIGTGNSSKDFLGLGAGVDDGGEVATYGGLSRSTWPTLAANETDVGGALTLAAMATMYDSCKTGSDKPNIIYTSESIWSDYEALLQPGVVNNQDGYRQVTARGMARDTAALKGEVGFDSLMYRGVPIVSDEKCTSGTMWFINEKYYDFYWLPVEQDGFTQIKVAGNKTTEGYYAEEGSKNSGFSWSGFKQPIDQFGEIGQILLLGNYITFFSKRHGVLNTIS